MKKVVDQKTWKVSESTQYRMNAIEAELEKESPAKKKSPAKPRGGGAN